MTGKYLQNGVNEQSIIIAGVTDQLSQYYKQLNFTDKEYDTFSMDTDPPPYTHYLDIIIKERKQILFNDFYQAYGGSWINGWFRYNLEKLEGERKLEYYIGGYRMGSGKCRAGSSY